MALWYFAALLFAIFSGLYWVNSPDRINPYESYQGSMAGLIYNCFQAGIVEARADTSFGATGGETRYCRATGASALTHSPIATGLAASEIRIAAYPATAVGGTAPARIVVAYLPADEALKGVPFKEVVRQVKTAYRGQYTTGLVTTVSSVQYIDTSLSAAVDLRVQVPGGSAMQGALAMVTTIP